MGTLLLLALFVGTSFALAAAVWGLGRRPSASAFAVLTLLPLTFTVAGLAPDSVLAPTTSLAGVPPWCHPDLASRMREGASPANPLLVDPLSQMEPWREAARRDLLFNPAASSGAALLGNGQSAGLFPLELLGRALPPVRATTFLQAAKLLLAAWGLFLLLRRLAVPESGALVGAAVFVGSAFLELWRLHTLTYVAALCPWIVVALLDLVRRPCGRGASVLAVTGALGVFAGHPETLLQVMVLACLVSLPCWWTRRRVAGSAFRWGETAALLSFLLAAPALLPFVENLLVSHEWGERQAGRHQDVELPLAEAVERAWPALDLLALGNPFDGTFRGPENLAEIGGAGVALAALALVPAAFSRRRYRRMAALWLLVGLLGWLASIHLPWVSRPFGLVPLLADTLLKRLSLWWVVAVSVLAGFGAANLLRTERHSLGRWGVAGAAVGLAGLLRLLAELALAPRTIAQELWALGSLAAVTLMVLLLPRRFFAPALMVLVLAPQVALFSRWIPRASAFSFYPSTPAVRYVQERAAGYRVSGLNAALLPHSAAFFGLEEVRGYDPLAFGPYVEFESIYAEPRRPGWAVLRSWSHPALDFLGVRYVFDHPTLYVFHHPGVRQVYEGEDALVYENPRAFPRLFRPAEVEIWEGAEAALAAARRIEDFAALATVSGKGLPPPGRYPNGQLEVGALTVEPGRIWATVEAGSAALAATSQPAIPGWRLTIDGRKAEPVRVNGAFLGVVVGPGRHELELRYAPRSFVVGQVLFAVGLAGVGLSCRDRRPSRPRQARTTTVR